MHRCAVWLLLGLARWHAADDKICPAVQALKVGSCQEDCKGQQGTSLIQGQVRRGTVLGEEIAGDGLGHGRSMASVTDMSPKAWEATIAWLKKNGATVTDALKSEQTQHGGFSIRGVVSTHDVPKHSTILEIPEKLWLEGASNKVINNTNFDCSVVEKNIRVAIVVALETQKGAASFWAPYLGQLPSLEDYESFHPRFTKKPLLDDFSSLGLVQTIKLLQENDAGLESCFGQWQKVIKSKAELKDVPELKNFNKLTWNDMRLALARTRTRVYKVGNDTNRSALIPGSDLLNTAPASALNTLWDFEGPKFKITALKVSEGQELYDAYCGSCTNDNMLSIWGVYLEDNANKMKPASLASCSALKKPAMEVLDTGKQDAKWTAPRCKKEALSGDQGPLRCSFARLAWESCAVHWKLEADKGAVSLEQWSPSPAEHATLAAAVDGSSIHDVHPALLAAQDPTPLV